MTTSAVPEVAMIVGDCSVDTARINTARAEALFCSPVSIGSHLDRVELDTVIAHEIRRRGSVANCAAEMAARYGEIPECAVRRMHWALGVVTEVYVDQQLLVGEPA